MIELPLAEASVKVRTGPPHDDPEDYETGLWAGVLPAQLVFGAAEPDPELRPGREHPGSHQGSGRACPRGLAFGLNVAPSFCRALT